MSSSQDNRSGQRAGFTIDLRARESFVAAFQETHAREELRLTARRTLRPGERYRLQLMLPAEVGQVLVDAVVMGVSPGPGGLEDERVVIDLRVVQAPPGFFDNVRRALGLSPPADLQPAGLPPLPTPALDRRATAPAPPDAALAPPEVAMRSSVFSPAGLTQPGGGPPGPSGAWPMGNSGAFTAAPPGRPAAPAAPAGLAPPSGIWPAPSGALPTPSGSLPMPTPSGAMPMPSGTWELDGVLGPAGGAGQRNVQIESFIVNLVKALTNPAGYSTDAAASRVRHQIFEMITALRAQTGGPITVVRTPGAESGELRVAELGALEALMSRGRSELFLPKLANYMARRGLLELGIGAGMTEAELGGFLEVLSAPPGKLETARADISIALDAKGVRRHHLRFEGDDEAGEKVSPRVNIVLGRLADDLRTVPLFRKEDSPEARALRTGHLRDVMRAFTDGADLRDIFLRCERLEEAWQRGSPGWSLVEALAGVLATEVRVAAAVSLIGYYRAERERARLTPDSDWPSREGHLRRVLGRLASVFLEERTPATDRVLKQVQQERMIGFDDLSEEVQERLAATKVVDSLLKNAPAALARFRETREPESYRRAIAAYRRALPELLRRGELTTVRQLLTVAAAHANEMGGEFAARPMMARELLKAASSSAVLRTQVDLLVKTRGGRRQEVVDALVCLGASALPRLLRCASTVTAELNDPDAEQHLADGVASVIAGLGRAVMPALRRSFEGEIDRSPGHFGHPVHGAPARRAIALAAGRLGDAAALPLLTPLQNDPAVEVRQAALEAEASLRGADGEEVLIRALNDPSPAVQRAAVRALDRLGSHNLRTLDFYRRMLQSSSEGSDHDALLGAVCEAIAGLARQNVPHVGELETTLIAELEREGRGRPRNPLQFKIAACAALSGFAALSERARRYLQRLSNDREPDVRRSAQAALAMA